MDQALEALRAVGLRPTPQRMAITAFVLRSRSHPSAEEVYRVVRQQFPAMSRATVYNTLRALARKGLVAQRMLNAGHAVFDGGGAGHHHLVDEETGEIHDIPWDRLLVHGLENLAEFDITDVHIVLRGRRKQA